MKPTVDLLTEVIDDMGETLAYAVLSPKVEEELLKALAKLKLVQSHLANPMAQQETKRYIPDNPFTRSDPEIASKVSELVFNSDRPYR